MIHEEFVYVVEWTPGYYLQGLTYPRVSLTTDNPFEAMRFKDKPATERMVAMLQDNHHARLVPMKLTLEINDA